MKKLTARILAPVLALLLGAPVLADDAAPPANGRVDVNTATKAQLEALPGVGPEQAERIIAARPYYKKEELKTKQVVSAEEFDKLQRLIDSVC